MRRHHIGRQGLLQRGAHGRPIEGRASIRHHEGDAVSYTHLDVYKRQGILDREAAAHPGIEVLERGDGDGPALENAHHGIPARRDRHRLTRRQGRHHASRRVGLDHDHARQRIAAAGPRPARAGGGKSADPGLHRDGVDAVVRAAGELLLHLDKGGRVAGGHEPRDHVARRACGIGYEQRAGGAGGIARGVNRGIIDAVDHRERGAFRLDRLAPATCDEIRDEDARVEPEPARYTRDGAAVVAVGRRDQGQRPQRCCPGLQAIMGERPVRRRPEPLAQCDVGRPGRAQDLE